MLLLFMCHYKYCFIKLQLLVELEPRVNKMTWVAVEIFGS